MHKSIHKQIALEWKPDSMSIIYSWFSLWKTLFATVAYTPLVIFYFVDYYDVAPILTILVCFLCSYLIFCQWVNKTHIVISKLAIKIQHKPFPWTGKRNIKTRNIKQIYSKEIRTRKSVEYGIFYQSYIGSDALLFDRFNTMEQALYVEKEIETYLKIKNKVVHGVENIYS